MSKREGGAKIIKVERFLCNWERTSKSIRKRGTKRELHNSDVGLIKNRQEDRSSCKIPFFSVFFFEWMGNTKLSVNQTWQRQDSLSKHWVQTYRSDFLLNILPPSADSAQISVKHAMMSLARPLVVSACADTQYPSVPITGHYMVTDLTSPSTPCRISGKPPQSQISSPFLTLTLSEQSEFIEGVHWALSVRDCWISFPHFPSFFHQTERIDIFIHDDFMLLYI